MKVNYFISLLVFGILVFTGCDNDDDATRSGNQMVESAFEAMYPDATRVSWEKEGQYYVVDFWSGNMEKEAWFDSNGAWYQTESDILFAALPEAVKTAFLSGDYKDWRIDDVDLFERKDTGTFYVLDVEKGNQEYDFHYSPDGTLTGEIIDL